MTGDVLHATVHHDLDAVRVEVHGELDLTTVPELVQLLERLRREQVERVVVDLRHVTFLGSTALHACDDLDAGARRDGRQVQFIRPEADGAWMPFVHVGLADRLVFVEGEPDG